jgi:hypothetical protein
MATAFSNVVGQTIVVDDWTIGQRVQQTPAGGGSQASSVQDSSILGTWRNAYVLSDGSSSRQTSFVSDAGDRIAAFNNESDATGLVRIFWDGEQRYEEDPVTIDSINDPLLDYLNGDNNLVVPTGNPDPQAPNSPAGGSINPIGLGGIDLTGSCSGSDDFGLSMLFGATDQGTITINVDVFTDGSNWSRATKSQNDGIPRVIDFAFPEYDSGGSVVDPGDFVDQGQNQTQGADFTDVGAIALSIEVDTAAVDVPFATPVVLGCGTDFADAPTGVGEEVEFQGSTFLVGGQSYRTFADEQDNTVTSQSLSGPNPDDPENRLLRGPHHSIGGPFFGLGSNETDSEGDGQPNSSATGDDSDISSNGSDDEAGITLSDLALREDGGVQIQSCSGIDMGPSENRENWYCASVQVSNPTNSWAQAVGWIDFRGSGSFDNFCGSDSSGEVRYDGAQSDALCERSSSTLIVGSGGLSNADGSTCTSNAQFGEELDQGGSFSSGGNVPPGCQGTVVMTWDLSNAFEELTLNETFSRFRISTDTFVDDDVDGFFSTSGPSPFGYASDGEVEDHVISAGTLPVSISGFETRKGRKGLEVHWSTVSETENVGFYLWNYRGGDLQLLTPDMIPSKAIDAAHPQDYRYTIPASESSRIGQLAITAVDNRGKEQMYGLFDAGQRYGRDDASSAIPWDGIRAQAEARLASLGFERAGNTWRDTERTRQPTAADFLVSQEGMQRITHDDLMAAGIDLRRQPVDRIAITVDGKPVAREIRTPEVRSRFARGNGRFRASSVIEFWGEKPQMPDARYIDDLIYRVELDRRKVRRAEESLAQPARLSSREYVRTLRVAEDNKYWMTNVLADPWIMAWLRDGVASQSSHTVNFELPNRLMTDDSARIEVLLAGANDLPVAPDHHVQLKLNGEVVAEEFFDGRIARTVTAEVPVARLKPGSNEVTVFLPGGTESPLDSINLESVTLHVPVSARSEDDRLVIHQYEAGKAIVADGFAHSGHIARAWNGERLKILQSEVAGRGMISALPPADEGYSVWISSSDGLHRPEPLGTVGVNTLLNESGDYLVIAHPAFLPAHARESHPLNEFVEARESEGWDVRLVDITEIQAHYGGGMPLPQAVRRFLAAADNQFAYEHVLLVGDDSYDYRDLLEMGSVSFIPTFYAATSRIPHTPSDGLMADLDGDGVADKAIGRWPVRTLADLESIVYKTLDWNGSMEGLRNAVWVADLEDPNQSSFQAQATRLMDQLVDAGWTESEVDSVFLNELASPDAGRDQLFGLLEQGRAFTGFVGHGAPSMWTFDGLLVPNDLAELDNFGLPTMISTSTCYTSYFVSPYSETVAHRWMNGYDEDAQGNPIPGARNGAVAIHGAATLSNYQQNEFVVSRVQGYQLDGMTLGQAVLQARRDAAERGLRDQVINWGLLGDPTLTVD